ncbi:amidohydrolase family protein [candidate division KSB1 bacterium]
MLAAYRVFLSILPIVALHLSALSLVGCATEDPVQKLKKMRIIDSHVHVRGSLDDAWAVADEYGVKYFNICTVAMDVEGLNHQIELSKELIAFHPDRFAWATSFELATIREPGWADRAIAGLKTDFEKGAVAVKVWKEIGMVLKNPDGSFVQIDDPRFKPIFEFIDKSDKTLVAHIGEPMAAWLPIEEMMTLNEKSYYSKYPQYHALLHPEIPHHDTIVAARDRVLAGYPNLRVVGCHLGSLEHDVDVLAQCLDTYPNFAVDTAARMAHLQSQDRDKVRRFLIKYQDRILYGTDVGFSDPKTGDYRTARKEIDDTYIRDFAYWAGDGELTSPDVEGPFLGVALPDDVLKKILYENAVKWYPGIAD